MTRKMGVDFLRPEIKAVQARLASEAECYPCVNTPMHYCVQCEVRDINHEEKVACVRRSG